MKKGLAKKKFGSAPRGELAKQCQSLSKGVCGLAFVWPFSRVKERAKDLAFFFFRIRKKTKSLFFWARETKEKRELSFFSSRLFFCSIKGEEREGVRFFFLDS